MQKILFCQAEPQLNILVRCWSLGRQPFPKIALFLVVVAGIGGKYQQKRMIHGGLAAPGTLWVNLPALAPKEQRLDPLLQAHRPLA
jgi:hypothetical protein